MIYLKIILVMCKIYNRHYDYENCLSYVAQKNKKHKYLKKLSLNPFK